MKGSVVPETGEPQSRKINALRSTCGNQTPIDSKRLFAAPPAPSDWRPDQSRGGERWKSQPQKWAKLVEQVPTKSGDGEGGFMPLSQLLKAVVPRGIGQPPSIEVLNTTVKAIEPDAKRLPPKGKGRAVRQGRRKKRKGGWRTRTGLTRQQVSDMYEAAYVARSMGQALSVAVTFNPDNRDGESAGARMRWIGKKVYGLAQALKRHAQPWIAMIVWQWPIGGRLHCHVLVWIEPGNHDVVSRFHNLPAVHVTKWGSDIGYFTRERLPSGPPEYEARQRWPRVTGNKITGQRLTISAALKALVTEHLADRQLMAQPRPKPAQPVSVAPVQLALFDGLPALPPPPFNLAAERKRRGLTQSTIGQMIGLRQPHVANVERGHDRLSPARQRVLRHILDALPVAA
jgi:hypothetical protein